MIGLGTWEEISKTKLSREQCIFSEYLCYRGRKQCSIHITQWKTSITEKKILLYCKDISCNEDRMRGFLKSVSTLIYYTHSVKNIRIDPQLEWFIKAHCHRISIFRSSVGILVSIIVFWNFYANLWQLSSHFSQILSEIQVFKLDVYP